MTIKPIAGEVKAFATFSAPKRISDDNYSPVTEAQFSEAIESVEEELSLNGIKADIRKARLSRVDTFKNILTDEETASYARLFGLLEANRAKDKTTHGASTWLMKNNSTEYCIYDKIEEMRNTGHLTQDLQKTLRFELRCKDSQKVKRFYKSVVTVQDLKAYGWSALQERSVKAWTDNFFKYDIDEIEILAESQIRKELQFFQAKYGRLFFSRYLKAYGAYFLASSSGGIEVIKKALENMDIDDKRKKIYRAERELKDALLLVESLKLDSTSPKTLGELYSELKYKMETA